MLDYNVFARNDSNRAWEAMQGEWAAIRNDSRVDADNIEYHALQLINAYVASLCGQPAQGSWNSCYYRIDKVISDLRVTLRVANHRGYCDSSYKRAHGRTGIAAFDKAIQDEPQRYTISIEIIKDKYRRSGMHSKTDSDDCITRIELVNINTQYLLEEALTYIDNEINDLF